MCTELLPVHQDGDIGEDVSAAQPVEVEQHVAGVARELYAAVCCARHLLKICKHETNKLGSVKSLSSFFPSFFF